MKVKSIVASAAAVVLGFALVASAASYTFSNYLSVGSTGADVSALQNFLIANGYSIPSISSGAAQPGYFGSQTQAAVQAYQTANSIPSTGFVGPLTVASLNKGGTAVTGTGSVAMACPAGFTCTPVVTTTATCPAGYTCTTTGTTGTTGTTLTGITTPGVAGSLDVSNGSYVGNGTAVNDGQEVDLGSVALQTGASDMQVSSVAVDFNVRPWLYMNSISLRDTSGKILGEVDNLNSSNFTEITVGSDYRINIPVSLVLPKATRTVAVLHGVFGTSNRAAQNIVITQVQVRSVDGTGVTLTSTFGNASTPNLTAMYASYGGSSNSSLVVSIDPNSPVAQTIQTNTGNTQTKNILLGVFDLKSQNINATLQGLTINVSMNGIGSVGTVFANLQLNSGSTLLNTGNIANTAASSSAVTFSNFNLALPQNTQVPVSVYATVNGNV
ncbi:MAG: peptidoglycan-binding domain-containing protein, partial [Candidatus Pacebacteria bacterium]|nr:peptidoglycan-binding domain-containing protein [Candidatus Paceibacterota bacterium]